MSYDPSALHDFLRSLANAVATVQLYSLDHPQVPRLIPQTVDAIKRFVGSDTDKTLMFVKGTGFLQGKPLPRTPHLDRISRLCAQYGIGFIRFNPQVTAVDVRQLIRILIGKEHISNLSSLNLQIGEIENPATGDDNSQTREISGFEDLTDEELQGITELFETVGQQQTLNIKSLATVVAGFITAFRREANPLLALVPLRLLDEYTFTHSVNVGILNIAQGMSLGIEGQLLHDIGLAGLLHDVGKIFTDRQLLKKPSQLSTEEWQIMKRHPSRGAQYLLNQPDIPTVAVITAFEHHMRYDLKGYPKTSPGWELSLCSQMTMISDTFDALRTRRVYKDSWDFPKISGHMLNLGGAQLNPDLTLNFLRVLRQMEERNPAQTER